jgi:hypothetical protein
MLDRLKNITYLAYMKKVKLPRDMSQRAKMIVDLATGEKEAPPSSYMAKIGRKGGKKGGPARAASLSPEKRSEIAKKAAAARWSKRP